MEDCVMTDREFMERENRRHRIAVLADGIFASGSVDWEKTTESLNAGRRAGVVTLAMMIDDQICEATK